MSLHRSNLLSANARARRSPVSGDRYGPERRRGFQPQGLARHGWASSGLIRDVFRRAFEGAGLPYFNPHSFRDMLVRHATTMDLSPSPQRDFISARNGDL
jgi:integrase